MALRFSTGLRDAMLGAVGFQGVYDGDAVIEIRSGVQPASADNDVSGTLLGEVTVDALPASYLSFDAPASGAIEKAAAETWQFTGLVDGTAGWFRLKESADAGGVSTTAKRVDGSIGQSGADLNLSNVNIVTGAPNTIDVFRLVMREQ